MGIPVDAVDFFAELELNNDRGWWTANQERWRRVVRDPMQRLCDELADEFGDAKLFRPHRDVRFSADKSPYKTHQGAVVLTSPGVGYYVQVSSQGLLTGGGWYQPVPEQIAAYRDAVLDDDSGSQLASIAAQLEGEGVELVGERLKTAPRGVDPGHPRIELLRHKTLLASVEHAIPDWLETDELAAQVADQWRTYRPLLEWLDARLSR
ncbi:uncharacterized protein (TIGR02453 family) [Propionicimonas paludicola]|uniref:Uncharacterized protein (TIGR02453 family) n=1 Tax=Propionicimonas paludicola TaxID=185243 RepID=A0A2A9CNL3_9ACTN|nr:DUF2461 domain-containing protein [Propionicimonas paludicola]PFG15983.1 uncharacterized protein (TIGR02453 family) [Propionicimonas paludicola]